MKLKELAALLRCDLDGDGEIEIEGVGSLDEATPGQITFAVNAKRARLLYRSAASAVILPPGLNSHEKPSLRTERPQLAFARALHLFHPVLPPTPGVHALAVIDPEATIDPTARIGPYVVVEKEAHIGARTTIEASTFVGEGVRIGDDCRIANHVSLRARAVLGNRVVLHSGVVIGADGFGFTPDEAGGVEKVPQVGTVIIEDDVEIGAMTAVDRATLGATRIRKSAKIDNLCQIAHNCDIGERVILAAQVGLSGSTRLERGVMMGGQSGTIEGSRLGEGVRVAAQAGVVGDVSRGQVLAGQPAIPMNVYKRAIIALQRLPELMHRVRQLERTVIPGNGDPREE